MVTALKHLKFRDIAVEQVNPMLSRQLVVGEQVMLARIILEKGCVVPEHSHFNEQVTYILEGALQFTIDGKEVVIRAGEVLCIPPNLPHAALALEYTVNIDIFVPPRADWLNGTDTYLQQANRA